MIYIFDTSSLRVLDNYYPARFPSLWVKVDELMQQGRLVSVREVYAELSNQWRTEHLRTWSDNNKHIFMIPTADETVFVAQVLAVSRFQALVERRSMLLGRPAADPFLIAAGKVKQGCVVTEERKKGNEIKIPLVCEYFEVDCTNVEGMMEREGWQF